MFVFNPHFWWVALIGFVVGFLLFLFVIKIPFIISEIFILSLSVYSTVMFSIWGIKQLIATLVILWLNFVLILFMHRGNIKRLLAGKENTVDLKSKIFKKKENQEGGLAEQKSEGKTESR